MHKSSFISFSSTTLNIVLEGEDTYQYTRSNLCEQLGFRQNKRGLSLTIGVPRRMISYMFSGPNKPCEPLSMPVLSTWKAFSSTWSNPGSQLIQPQQPVGMDSRTVSLTRSACTTSAAPSILHPTGFNYYDIHLINWKREF
jgi:hypothetical protein